jgi:hypothetical protein
VRDSEFGHVRASVALSHVVHSRSRQIAHRADGDDLLGAAEAVEHALRSLDDRIGARAVFNRLDD